MNKAELQVKLDEALIGKGVYYNDKVCDYVRPLLSDWFNDTQGYYGIRVYNNTYTITYKRYGIVSFDIKRKKDDTHGFVVKSVVIEEDFVDTETNEAKAHEHFAKELTDEWRWAWRNNPNIIVEMKELFRAVRLAFPNKKASELKDLLHDLKDDFWLIEDTING